MLEERLSHTYSQHTVGGNRSHAPHLTPSIYPSIPSGPPTGNSGTESYYNMQNSSYADQYTRPRVDYQGYSQRQPSYTQYNSDPHRTTTAYAHADGSSPGGLNPSYVTSPQRLLHSPATKQDPAYPQGNAPQGYQQHQDYNTLPQAQTPSLPPHQTPLMPQPADSAVAYYHGTDEQVSPPQSHYQQNQDSSYAPSLPSPEQTQAPPTQSSQNSVPPQQQQSGYWPQPTNALQSPQFYPQQGVAYSSNQPYTQESFPSAPQHQPQPKAVEESLIDL